MADSVHAEKSQDLKNGRRLDLYNRGRTDSQIAAVEGCSRCAIRGWRKKNGLPAKGTPHLPRKVEAERMALYKRRYDDHTIARIQGVTRFSIGDWRKARGLAPNVEPGGKRGPRDETAEDQRMRLYRLGRTDPQIAAALAITRQAVKLWRYRRGLDANDGKPLPDGPARFVSLDADLGEGGFNLHGLIADDAASEWLESVGATRW